MLGRIDVELRQAAHGRYVALERFLAQQGQNFCNAHSTAAVELTAKAVKDKAQGNTQRIGYLLRRHVSRRASHHEVSHRLPGVESRPATALFDYL